MTYNNSSINKSLWEDKPAICFEQASGLHYLKFLEKLHKRRFSAYFEIGSRSGDSLCLSNSPSVAIDPFFQLKYEPVGQKDFLFISQKTSDDFFLSRDQLLPNIKCELGFIDGMHLFEYALRDFINLSKISKDKSLFLFHDCIPWSYEMTTRNYHHIPKGKPWVGDIWKLIPIFQENGLSENLAVLDSAPSGLLAIFSPNIKQIKLVEEKIDVIIEKWKSITLENFTLMSFYSLLKPVIVMPDEFLKMLEESSFGQEVVVDKKTWISH